MSRRMVIRVSATVVAGLVLAASAVLAAVAPWPTIGQTGPGQATGTPGVDVTPIAAEAVLACDGPLVALGRDASDASGLSHVRDLDVNSRNGLQKDPASEPDLELGDVGASLSVSQLPVDGESVPVAAAGSAIIDEPDVSGVVASACRPAIPETWIAGATVQTGVTDVLLIANPSDVVATVTLSVYGVDGRQDPAGGEIALSPKSQQAVPVASIAGEEQSPVIRLTSRGAPVRATLQSSRVETLEPAGLDLQSGTSPTTESVVPGIHVTEASAGNDDPTQVRLLGTNSRGGTVDVEVVDESSGETAFSTTADLTADVPVTVGFEGLDVGTYAVRLSGDVPFVSAVRQASGGDYTWLAPEEPLTGTSLVALPESPTGRFGLSFAAVGDEGATVHVERLAGDNSWTLELEPGRSETIDVRDWRAYRVTVENGRVAGSAGVVEDGAIAAFPLAPDAAEPDTITVAP